MIFNLIRYLNNRSNPHPSWTYVVLGILLLFASIQPVSPLSAQENKPEQKDTKQAEQAEQPKKEVVVKNATRVEEKLAALNNLYVPIHWTDPATGLALGGFDPIAYLEFSKPKPGDEDYEYVWHGVSWRFMNQGNLNAFKRSPSRYAPVYAGYDAYALSQGILSIGYPSLWTMHQGRLHLFHTEVNLYLWSENAKNIKQKTNENWQSLSLDLPRYKIE